jgi:hypothetical protein
MSKNSNKQLVDQLTQWIPTLKSKQKKRIINKSYGKTAR